MARQASTASWQVKALVEATPISGPASVGITTIALPRDRRGRHVHDGEDVLAVLLGVRSVASVSAVSPDCDTKIARLPGVNGASR